jgi:hypothetical protein
MECFGVRDCVGVCDGDLFGEISGEIFFSGLFANVCVCIYIGSSEITCLLPSHEVSWFVRVACVVRSCLGCENPAVHKYVRGIAIGAPVHISRYITRAPSHPLCAQCACNPWSHGAVGSAAHRLTAHSLSA